MSPGILRIRYSELFKSKMKHCIFLIIQGYIIIFLGGANVTACTSKTETDAFCVPILLSNLFFETWSPTKQSSPINFRNLLVPPTPPSTRLTVMLPHFTSNSFWFFFQHRCYSSPSLLEHSSKERMWMDKMNIFILHIKL